MVKELESMSLLPLPLTKINSSGSLLSHRNDEMDKMILRAYLASTFHNGLCNKEDKHSQSTVTRLF